MKLKNNRCSWVGWGMVVLLVLGLSGCAGMSSENDEPMSDRSEKSKQTTAIYHDFEDVLVPLELTVMNDRTIVVSTPGFKSGILALKGRVDSTALFNFFTHNMLKDNWSVVSRIKSPSTDIMVFEKTSRVAVITIRSSKIYSYVEIGVAPRIGTAGSGMSQGNLTE